jgi:hypothetical protein
MKELEVAAEDFGKSIGGTGLRVLVMLFTYFAGKVLPAPKPSTGGGGGMAPATTGPGGARVVIVQGTRVTILADGSVVMAPIAMATTGSGAGGGGSFSKDEITPKDEKTAPGTEKQPAQIKGSVAKMKEWVAGLK